MDRLIRLILFGSLLVSFLIAWGMPLPNEDLFLGFCAGRDILEGHLASPDRWSFTLSGAVWVDQSWLSHLAYYVAFLKLGYLGPVLVKGLLLSGCLALLYFRCRSVGASRGFSLVAVTLGTLAVAPFMKIRAENFGMFYFMLMSSAITQPASWGRWRYVAVLLVLALWTNSHGSFMLGFLLIGLKLFQEVLERFAGWDETSGPAGLGWLITLLLSLVVMAFANPYGPENLLVPFRQLFETTVTSQWVDWRPLIHEETLFTRGFFKPLSVLPFLGLVTLTMLLPMILLATKEGRGKLHALLSTTAASHLRMEVLMALLLAPLVLKFQRMIIFATPALVPLLAASAQCYAELISERSHVLAGFRESRAGVAMRTALASVVLLLIATVFYKSIVLRYAPGNPLNYDKSETPLTQRLMSPNFMRTDAVEFMKKNGIRGRVFTNIYLSNYLLFYVPDIKLFLDLRAQSVFPPRIIRDYLEIVDPEPLDPTKGVNLLETFKVSFAVLDTSSSATSLAANKLMETRRWGCIYSDSWGVILASVDEERFGPLVVTADLEGLWYSRPETRVASQALLEFFMKGTIRPELFERLIKVQRQIEDPNMYSLIVETMNSGSECLNSRTKIYLESEIARLSAADHLVTGGAFSTLRSLLRLLELLERNELLCEGPRLSGKYTLSKRRFSDLLDDIKARYGGL